jgi:hypothetical protein
MLHHDRLLTSAPHVLDGKLFGLCAIATAVLLLTGEVGLAQRLPACPDPSCGFNGTAVPEPGTLDRHWA